MRSSFVAHRSLLLLLCYLFNSSSATSIVQTGGSSNSQRYLNASTTVSQPKTTSSDSSTITSLAWIEPSGWNLWRTNCISSQSCTIYCEADDESCWSTANSIISTCGPSWHSWQRVASGSASSTGSEWTKLTTEFSYSGQAPESTTVLVYTTFSTANVSFVKQDPVFMNRTTMTPVYAVGTPMQSLSVDTGTPDMITYMTAPTPDCKFVAVSTWNASYCGPCRIAAGTVDLYYWPSATSAAATNGTALQEVSTAVVDGTTLVSPSVYISLRTIYAGDACATVGRPHVGSMIAMQPEDISTIIHIGGKVAAYTTGALDYDILTGGLPPAKEYEMLPSCIMFGCDTIKPMMWSPTLVAPSQVRTLDASWAQCDLALQGFYDPPRALSARHAAAEPTTALAPVETTATPRQTFVPVPMTSVSSAAGTTDAVASQSPVSSAADPVHSANRPAYGAAQPLPGTEHDSTSTRSLKSTIWADVITMTTSINYGSSGSVIASTDIDDPEFPRPSGHGASDQPSGEGSSSQPFPGNDPDRGVASTDSAPVGPPSPYLRPQPLDSGNGVSILDQRLTIGEAMTVGHGPSKTTLSLQTQGDDTVLLYGTSAAAFIPQSDPNDFAGHTIYHASGSAYVIESQTLVPGSAITIGSGREEVTYSMKIKSGYTFAMAGTTSTMSIIAPHSTQPSPVDLDDLAFTQASNGDFVLHGTTLEPGEPVMIGSGRDKATLEITSLKSMPAIVIDGTMTAQLSHPPVVSNSSSTSVSQPTFTSGTVHVSTQAVSATATTASKSMATSIEVRAHVLFVMLATTMWKFCLF